MQSYFCKASSIFSSSIVRPPAKQKKRRQTRRLPTCLRFQPFVELFEQRIEIFAVNGDRLRHRLAVRQRAAEAVHARRHQNLGGVGVELKTIGDQSVRRNFLCHWNSLLFSFFIILTHPQQKYKKLSPDFAIFIGFSRLCSEFPRRRPPAPIYRRQSAAFFSRSYISSQLPARSRSVFI